MNMPGGVASTAEKYSAARNALVAKYTFETLGEDQKRKVDDYIVDLLILSGINASRAARYKTQLRDTQYYGMAAIAMAFLNIQPALPGILFRERWEHVHNPLIALTGAYMEVEMASNEILRKHRVPVVISDEDKRGFKWESLIQENRKPRDMN